MGDDSGSTGGGGSIFGQFFGHVFDLPRWQKLVLTLAGLLGAAGLGGKVTGAVSDSPNAPTTQAASASSTPRSSFVADADKSQPAAAEDSSLKALLVHNAPWMTRVGVGFIGAFIVGWLFRAFIKLMTMMTIVVVLLLGGLNYFRVIDIDFKKAEEQYATASAWVTDQAGKARDAIMAHIPASMSSTLGMFLGFRRK